MAARYVALSLLPELRIMAEVLTMRIKHIVLQPQHASQHSQMLILHNGRTVYGLVPLT